MWHTWGENRFKGGFWSGKQRDLSEGNQLADLGVDVRIVLKSKSSGNNIEAVECIYLSQDRKK
jgi:hypothetical protein